MSQLDMYGNTMSKKQEEISKLNQDMAKERAKIAPLMKKIISAKEAAGRTKSQATLKLKMKEIERSEKAISDCRGIHRFCESTKHLKKKYHQLYTTYWKK